MAKGSLRKVRSVRIRVLRVERVFATFSAPPKAGQRGFETGMDFRSPTGIIIPAYNAEAYISQTVAPLLSQMAPDRIAVVDDGSQDRTGNIVAALGITCLRHAENQGKGSALMT